MDNLWQHEVMTKPHSPLSKTAKSQSTPAILVQNVVFCTGIALILWKFVPTLSHNGFWIVFVHSQLIGNTICLMIIASPHLISWWKLEGKIARAMAMIAIALLGAFVGQLGSSVVLGLPSREIFTSTNIAICAIVAIAATFTFNSYLSYRDSMLALKLSASEERRRADNARHAMLQAQLEPHMLFNTLANLRALIDSDTEKALEMLDRLDSFLRETLSSSQKTTHTLEHEFNILDDYLSLIKVRFGDRLNYSLDISEDCKPLSVPSLLLQQTKLTVSDTGVGFRSKLAGHIADSDKTEHSSSQGFGLANLRERLAEAYGKRASIAVTAHECSGQTGTTITVSLPR